jgi:protein O-GlcNAc transferase
MQGPNSAQLVLARAFAAHQAGDIGLAENLYNLVLLHDKKQFDALHMLGIIEGQRGNYRAGLRRLKNALRVRPGSADALINLGRMQSELGDNSAAIATYEKVLEIAPQSPLAHVNVAIVLSRQRRYDEALLHCSAAVDIASDFAEGWNRRANVLLDMKRPLEALDSYDRALLLQPSLAEAHLGRANILGQLERYDEALAHYHKALALNPNLSEAWHGCGLIFFELKQYEEAIAAYDKAMSLNHEHSQSARLSVKMETCYWKNLESECADLVAAVMRQGRKANPMRMLAASDSLADQFECAKAWVADQCPSSRERLWGGERYRHDRIRVAYLSTDFKEHPVATLIVGLFEQHDRARFELIGLSFGPDQDSPMRRRIKGAFERFVDVRRNSQKEIAELIRGLEIDIAIDLTGHTRNGRPGILACRPAPVQVNYLGFAGTMGAKYMDYIIADRTVIPEEHFKFYCEKVIWMPDSFMVNDARRVIGERTPSRAELGLPDKGFVFCCFNQSHKITPSMFAIWMGLLQAVDGSVLWLKDNNPTASCNLRREAGHRGVSPDRLVFASRVSLEAEHLARLRQADLFLDTAPYNAHATASDALWAGVPLVTCIGSSFAGRVAESLLKAIGMSELVTASLDDYRRLALKIAMEPGLCASLKQKLARNRELFPLFDTKRFARHVEAAYTVMWERSQRGEQPCSFAVSP